MKIVVIGGTGALGSKVIQELSDRGHDAIAASPRTAVNALTGDGLAYVPTNADVIVNVANSPSCDDGPVMEFFTKSTANLLVAAEAARVGHYVAVPIVGAEKLPRSDPDVGYFGTPLSQHSLVVT